MAALWWQLPAPTGVLSPCGRMRLQAQDAAVAALAAQGGAADAASGEVRSLVTALTRTFAELEAQVAGPGLTDWACLGVGCAPAAATCCDARWLFHRPAALIIIVLHTQGRMRKRPVQTLQ